MAVGFLDTISNVAGMGEIGPLLGPMSGETGNGPTIS